MNWIVLSLLALVLWTISNILDKFIVDHELKDPIFVTAIFCLSAAVLLVGSSLFYGVSEIPWLAEFLSLLTGLIYSLSVYLYYHVMRGEEVSRFVPLISIEPVFIAIGAAILFGERLGLPHYVGIALVVLGAILISRENVHSAKEKHRFQLLHWLALLMILLFAGKNLLVKYLFGANDFWTVMFWFGLGSAILPAIFLIFHRPRLCGRWRRGAEHIILSAIFSSAALIFFSRAISIGSVSLVIALISVKPMLVFAAATLCSFVLPKFIFEKHTKKIILQKIAATALIVIGGVLVVI